MKFLKTIFLFLTIALLSACQNQTEDANTVKIGTISGPETELMKVAKCKLLNLVITLCPMQH
jgi:ABC-type metal ion transport system substrate-binding protein